MNGPLISIIVPVYKVELYLEKCIKSILDQTYKNLEILLVDDGSPDRSGILCDDWAKVDSRIKVIHQENKGASAARNAALRVATGDYIGFVDSDDYVAPEMYEVLLNTIIQSGKKISCCGAYRAIDNKGLEPFSGVKISGVLDIDTALDKLFYWDLDTAVWSKLFERSIWKNVFFPEGEINEEFSILIPLFVKSGGVACTNQRLYYYRQNSTSVTSTWIFNEKQVDVVYKNIYRMKKQLQEYGFSSLKSFRFFSAYSAYNCVFFMEKHYEELGEEGKKVYQKYRAVLKDNLPAFLLAKQCTNKDRLLCVMALLRVIRPLYTIFYRSHLKK